MKNCLNCRHEPDWSEFSQGKYGTSSGDCKYPMPDKILLPECSIGRYDIRKLTIIRYKDDSGICNNCNVWETNKRRLNCIQYK